MRKLISLMITLLLAFGVLGSTVLAQDASTTYCGDLSASDCDLLTASQTAMADVTEGTFELDVQLDGMAEGESLQFGFNLGGTYARNPEALPNFDNVDPETTTLSQAIDLVQNVLGAFSADVTLNLSLPQQAQAEGLPAELTIESRYLNSTGYINFDTIPVESLGGPAISGWHGMDLSQAVREASAFAGQEAMDQTLAQLGFSMDQVEQTNQFSQLQQQIEENPGEFLQVQRLADSTVNGTNVAVFETTVDIAAVAENEAFQQAIREQVESQSFGASEEEVQEQIDQQLAVMQNAQPMAIQQSIGLDDNYVYLTTVDWTFEVPADVAESDMPASFTLDASFSHDDFNNAPAIEAPADAILHTVMELLGGFSGGMGGSN